MTRCLIYVRISNDREGAGLGVARQEKDCRELAERLGWTVVGVHVDNDMSAYSGKPRPGYRALLAALSAGSASAVIAWHNDRLHRSPVELEEFIAELERRKVQVQTVKAGNIDLSTPSGRMVARQLGSVARYEVEHQVERQLLANAERAAAGRWGGGRRPFGYEPDGVTIRATEAEGLRWAAMQILAGKSLGEIAKHLARQGLTTSTGKPLDTSTLRRCLINPRYIGKRVYRPNGAPKKPQAHYSDDEIVGDAVWPAILEEETWRSVRAVLMDPTRKIHDKHGQRVWLGSGLYLTPCGGLVRSAAPSGQPPSYACREDGCVSRQADLVDDLVRAAVAEYLRELPAMEEGEGEVAEALQIEQVSMRARLNELSRQFAAGLIDGEQMTAGSVPLRAQLEAAQLRQADLSRQARLSAVIGKDDAVEAFLSGSVDYQRLTVKTLVEVSLLPAKRGRPKGWRPGLPYFDPATVQVIPRT